MKKLLCVAILIAAPIPSIAGFTGPTSHSRANCGGFNESVSWYWNNPDYRRVISQHFQHLKANPHHQIDTGMSYTSRAAAYHPTEAYSSRGDNWRVVGYHFYFDRGSRTQQLGWVSEAVNCNIYDGWWDY